MTAALDVFTCDVCGNTVEMIYAGMGKLVCCNQPMRHVDPEAASGNPDTHKPVIEAYGDGCMVTVGTEPHVMEPKHFIEWVELVADTCVYRRTLAPNEKPQAFFPTPVEPTLTARAHCNQHGLWRS